MGRFGIEITLTLLLITKITFHRVVMIQSADAFSPISTGHMNMCQQRSRYDGELLTHTGAAGQCSSRTNTNSTNAADITEGDAGNCNAILTSAVLKIAYDGTHFRGWTGSSHRNNSTKHKSTSHDKQTRRQSRRSRTLQRKGSGFIKGSDSIRTVEQALKISLAKLYGNVPPDNVMFDSCSRTDAGVHATSLIAQFYCLSHNREDFDIDVTSNNTWAQLRPHSPTDTNFLPLPFDLSKLIFVLNRMLPPDVRVIASSPVPIVQGNTPTRGFQDVNQLNVQFDSSSQTALPFHPTLHVKSKTYTYQFSVGPVQDPIRSQYVWHLDGSSNRAVGMNGKKFCLKRAVEAASVFVETIQPRDYSAFRSAFRGNELNMHPLEV
jgi:tRNA U38,U39,U40 pseudouridine synthase TruA